MAGLGDEMTLELRGLNALLSLQLMARNRLNEACERGNTRALAGKRSGGFFPMTMISDIEYLKRSLRESIRLARSEGVSLEEFLDTQNRCAPAHVTDGGRVVMFGWAVILWFEGRKP